MSGLKELAESTGLNHVGGTGCGAKYGGKKGKRSTKKAGKSKKSKKARKSKKSKKVRKSKKSKKSGKRKTSKKTFLSRLFKV